VRVPLPSLDPSGAHQTVIFHGVQPNSNPLTGRISLSPCCQQAVKWQEQSWIPVASLHPLPPLLCLQADVLRRRLGLQLFNFDLICPEEQISPNECLYYVIDINYFPGECDYGGLAS